MTLVSAKIFLNMTARAQETKVKMNNYDYIKLLKKLLHTKKKKLKIQRQSMNQKKIFTPKYQIKDILYPKNSCNLITTTTEKIVCKINRETKQTFSQRYPNVQWVHNKILSISNNWKFISESQ